MSSFTESPRGPGSLAEMGKRMYRDAPAVSPKNHLSGRAETTRTPHQFRDVGTNKQPKVDTSREHAKPRYLVTANLAWSVETALGTVVRTGHDWNGHFNRESCFAEEIPPYRFFVSSQAVPDGSTVGEAPPVDRAPPEDTQGEIGEPFHIDPDRRAGIHGHGAGFLER